jgi:sugar transferase (PEP-CTERM/EpsH1 system associated)
MANQERGLNGYAPATMNAEPRSLRFAHEKERNAEVIDKTFLIAHVIYRLDVGGLENGLVNLINRMPGERYRHIIVCVTGYTDFRNRLQKDLPVYAMAKREGNDPALYFRLWRLFRRLKPDIVHTRNLATLEAQLPAFLAGVPHRVHGEHGRDVHDIDNTSRKYRSLRAAFRPLIQRYIPLSRDLEEYLEKDVRVPPDKIVPICNGVDAERFHPAKSENEKTQLLPKGFAGPDMFVIGTVGRMEKVKDQVTLARAFAELVTRFPKARDRLRLVIVGEGSLRREVESVLNESGLVNNSWLAGSRSDVPELLRTFDVFVLPSLGEGISNTILEAMATGLPVVATDVGGNGELVEDGRHGYLVRRNDPVSMAERLELYARNPSLCSEHGKLSRERAERKFSLDGMVQRYTEVYDELARAHG